MEEKTIPSWQIVAARAVSADGGDVPEPVVDVIAGFLTDALEGTLSESELHSAAARLVEAWGALESGQNASD